MSIAARLCYRLLGVRMVSSLPRVESSILVCRPSRSVISLASVMYKCGLSLKSNGTLRSEFLNSACRQLQAVAQDLGGVLAEGRRWDPYRSWRRRQLSYNSRQLYRSHKWMIDRFDHVAMLELGIVGTLANIQYDAERILVSTHRFKLALRMTREPFQQLRIDDLLQNMGAGARLQAAELGMIRK